VDVLMATEAARTKRAGYWIIGGVFGAIGIVALFIALPSVPLVPVAATGTPKRAQAPVAAKDVPTPASATAAAAAPGEPARETPPEMKPDDAEGKEKMAEAGDAIGSSQVLGGSRRAVDELLGGTWTVRPSVKKVAGMETVFYDGDVNIIVQFRANRAVSVNVIAPSTPTPRSIGPEQYRSLLRMIGQAPKDADMRKDATGILEFTVGEKVD
jgi:hypothetical protein